MIFSPTSVLCIIGYAIASRLICELMAAGIPEQWIAATGVIPVGMYCALMDAMGE